MGKLLLTDIISKVISLEVVNENMTRDVLNALDISTLIDALTQGEYFSGSMCDNFGPSCSSLAITCSSIVITFYPKSEESLSFDHLIVGALIVIERFHIIDVLFDITTATATAEIYDVEGGKETKCQTNI